MSENFWKIENSQIKTLNKGTQTISDTSVYTPVGAYTTFRTYDRYGVLRLTKHFDRLEETSLLTGHKIHLDREKLKAYLTDIIDQTGSGEKRIRITVDLEDNIGTLYIAEEPLHVPSPEQYKNGITCLLTEAHRENPKAKLSNFLEKAENIRQNETGEYDEILMYSPEGKILEGLSSNFFGVIGNTVYTAEEGVLSGTTRDFILRIAAEISVSVFFEPILKDQISMLDEAFISSTSRSILPIRKIEGVSPRKSVPGPITNLLSERYASRIKAEIEYLTDK